MTQAELEAVLGRSLTSVEVSNLTLYLNIATQTLEDLICTPFEPVEEERVFDTRKGYSTAFVDIFNSVSVVKINDEEIDASDYSIRQWNKRNGAWYNSIVFDDKFSADDEVKVTAQWGFVEEGSGTDLGLPADLQAVLGGLFSMITQKNSYDGTINSKQVEDFRISFNADSDLDQEFYQKYRMTIAKYSLCDIINVQHGDVCEDIDDYRF